MKGSNIKAIEKSGGERTATGRPSSLREMCEGSLREWDNHMIELPQGQLSRFAYHLP